MLHHATALHRHRRESEMEIPSMRDTVSVCETQCQHTAGSQRLIFIYSTAGEISTYLLQMSNAQAAEAPAAQPQQLLQYTPV